MLHQQVEHLALAGRATSGRSGPGCRRAGRWRASGGRLVIRLSGQVRSGMSTASYRPYLWIGIPEGFWASRSAVRRRAWRTADGVARSCAWAPRGSVREDGRLSRNAAPDSAGRGSAYDYRPSPRQLRRSSPKRMMRSSLAEPRAGRRAVSVCGTGPPKRTKVRHTTSGATRASISAFHQSWWQLVTVDVTQCNGAGHDDQRGLRARLLHHRAAPRPRQAGPAEDPALAGPARRTLERDAFQRTRRRLTTVVRAPAVARAARHRPAQAAPHDLRRPARHGPARAARSAPRATSPARTPRVNRAYAGLGATFELLPEGLRPPLDRRRRPAAGRHRPLRRELQQRLLERRADGVRRRRRRDLPRLHHPGRRHRPRADPRRHAVHGEPRPTSASPGALNESMSDVFGSLIKQYTLGQTAAEADWLIGAGLLAPRVTGIALRSMKEPGTAYDDDVLGKDPQPGDDGRLRPHRPRQRRRPHQLRHPQPRLLPASPPPSAATPGSGRARSGTTS